MAPLVGTFLALAGPARAAEPALPPADPPPVSSVGFFEEVRLGGLAHGFGNPERGTWDVNAEVLSRRFDLVPTTDPFWKALAPRLHLGASINTGGRTSQGYVGLTWIYDVTRRLFVEGSVGGAVNDGRTGYEGVTPFNRAKLGCHVLFRESASVGYRLTESWSVMATLDHVSNGTLCGLNRGLNTVGLRLGYRF